MAGAPADPAKGSATWQWPASAHGALKRWLAAATALTETREMERLQVMVEGGAIRDAVLQEEARGRIEEFAVARLRALCAAPPGR